LYQVLDRQSLADVMTLGLGPPADSWFRPDEPIRREMEASIPKYPYDRTRALQQLAQAGWTPGSDGTLVHSSAERFELEIWMNPQASEKALAIVADQWKSIGLDTKPSIIPPARSEDREYTAQRSGPLLTGAFIDTLLAASLLSLVSIAASHFEITFELSMVATASQDPPCSDEDPCAPPDATPDGTTVAPTASGIQGQVFIGPTCPVVRLGQDCA